MGVVCGVSGWPASGWIENMSAVPGLEPGQRIWNGTESRERDRTDLGQEDHSNLDQLEETGCGSGVGEGSRGQNSPPDR